MNVPSKTERQRQHSRSNGSSRLTQQQRILLSYIVTLVGVSLTIVIVSTVILYRAAIDQQRERLYDMVRSQARLMEAVARHEAEYSTAEKPEGARTNTLKQIIDSHSRSTGLGETGEFTLAERRSDQIVFLFGRRYEGDNSQAPIAWDAQEAEPMRRALQGLSGTCIAADYRGETVLAAFEPVEGLNVGLVSKLDLSEIREPFIIAGALSSIVAIIGVILGTSIVSRFTGRLIMQVFESRERLQALHEAASDAIVSADDKENIVSWNKAATRTFGYTWEEAIGQPITMVMPEWSRVAYTTVCKTTASTTEGGECTVELQAIRKDGTELPVEIAASNWETQKDSFFTAFIRDISRRKATQEQLLHAQKMESVGLLAAGIAHEINTPIQYVGDNTRFVRDSIVTLMGVVESYAAQLDPEAEERCWEDRAADIKQMVEEVDLEFLLDEIPMAIEQTLDGVERVARIVRAMKEFSHPGSSEKTPTDLNKAIESTITVCRNRWKYVAVLEMDFEKGLPPVPCLVGEFNQVILNIVVNAADAISENIGDDGEGTGQIKVSTRQVDEFIEIRVSDTGGGIPEEIRQKVFDPFFTTKATGKGTGQGLAISHDVIVNKHGGTLEIEVDPGVGTTFIIRMPMAVPTTTVRKEAA